MLSQTRVHQCDHRFPHLLYHALRSAFDILTYFYLVRNDHDYLSTDAVHYLIHKEVKIAERHDYVQISQQFKPTNL